MFRLLWRGSYLTRTRCVVNEECQLVGIQKVLVDAWVSFTPFDELLSEILSLG
jgi:hypothetical protein